MRVFERSSDLDQAHCCIFIRLKMRAERVKRLLFEFGKKIADNFHHTSRRHLGSLPPGFFFFTSVFFLTMPLEKRISLDTKGAIIALRGEGLSLCAIGHMGNFKRRAETVSYTHLRAHET